MEFNFALSRRKFVLKIRVLELKLEHDTWVATHLQREHLQGFAKSALYFGIAYP